MEKRQPKETFLSRMYRKRHPGAEPPYYYYYSLGIHPIRPFRQPPDRILPLVWI